MSSKIFSLFAFSLFALIFVTGMASAVTLADWTLTANAAPTNVATGVSAGTFINSSALTNFVFGANGAKGENWSLTNSVDTIKYFEVTISPQTGNTLTISDINFNYSASIIGPASFVLQYSKQSGFGSPTTVTTKTDVNTTEKSSLNNSLHIQVNSGETITLRWFGYNFNANTNEFRVKNLNLQGTVTPVSTTPAEITACTSVGNPGNIEVKKIDFTNNGLSFDGKTFGKDDEWFPLENVEVQIDVKNQGNANDDKVNNIEVNWGLYDTDTNQWVIELVDEKDFDLKSGKTNTLTVSFKIDDKDLDVDLSDLSDGDHYKFYVTAQGETDDGNDTVTCASDFEPASVVVESDFVILDNIQAPETAQCGATVEVSADVWNIGDDDQDEVSVQVFNKDLGVNQKILVGDVDAFDKKKMSFTFTAPKNVEEKTYSLTAQVLNEDGDVYQNDYDDDYAEFVIPLVLKGGCVGATAPLTVTANLVSGGKAGQDLVVKATVVNSGNNSATYTLSSSGHAQWASTYTVSPTTLTLAAGQSGEATYTFKVNKDASGEQTFYIEVVSGTQVTRQPVSVMIERAGFFDSITGGAISENAWVWGLGILNVILIIVIILVAMRVMRK